MKSERIRVSLVALGVGLVAVALFLPCQHFQFLDWDDGLYLITLHQHPDLSFRNLVWMFTALRPFYYQPLTWLSYGLDISRGNFSPVEFHAGNVWLHGVNAALAVVVTWLIARASAGPLRRWKLAAAGWVGFVFAVHPLQVEAVAWMAERKTLLCAMFCLLSVGAYLLWGGAPTRRRWWWVAIVFFVGALLSKPMAITLPLALLALDGYPLQRHRREGWIRLGLEKWPLAVFSTVALVLTFIGQRSEGAVMDWQSHGALERGLVAARGLIFYLVKLVWPAWLSPFYPLAGAITMTRLEYAVPVLGCVLITAAGVWLWRRTPALAAGWFAFVILLVPVLGLLQVGSQAVGDRFVYLALLVPVMLTAGALCHLCVKFTTVGRIGVLFLLIAHGGYLVERTRAQLPVWQDDVTLWTAVLSYYPDCGIALARLASAEWQRGNAAAAVPLAQAAIEQEPTYPVSYFVLVDFFIERHDFARALPLAERAVAIAPQDVGLRGRLGLLYLMTGKPEAATGELQRALAADGTLVAARYNLACALSQLGRFAVALESLQTAVARDGEFGARALRDRQLAALFADPVYGPKTREWLAAQMPGGVR